MNTQTGRGGRNNSEAEGREKGRRSMGSIRDRVAI